MQIKLFCADSLFCANSAFCADSAFYRCSHYCNKSNLGSVVIPLENSTAININLYISIIIRKISWVTTYQLHPIAGANDLGIIVMSSPKKLPILCSQAPYGQDCCCCKFCGVGGCDVKVIPCGCCLHAVRRTSPGTND